MKKQYNKIFILSGLAPILNGLFLLKTLPLQGISTILLGLLIMIYAFIKEPWKAMNRITGTLLLTTPMVAFLLKNKKISSIILGDISSWFLMHTNLNTFFYIQIFLFYSITGIFLLFDNIWGIKAFIALLCFSVSYLIGTSLPMDIIQNTLHLPIGSVIGFLIIYINMLIKQPNTKNYNDLSNFKGSFFKPINILTQKILSEGNLSYILIFLVGFDYVFYRINSIIGLAGFDDYYHIKMAKLIPQLGIIKKFPWLFYTTLKEQYIDHHFLFHLLMTPFVAFKNSATFIAGAKIYESLIIGMIFVLFYKLLIIKKTPFAIVWTLLILALPGTFFYRISLIRVMGLSLCILLGGLIAIEKKNYILLGILSFLYVWTYGGAFFLPIISFVFFLWDFLLSEKPDYKLVIVPMFAYILALVLNPFFPDNINFLYIQIFKTGLGANNQIPVGNEWKPYDTWTMLQIAMFPFIAIGSALVLNFFEGKKYNKKLLSYFFIQLIFLLLFLKSRRFIEYWAIFSLLFTAVAFSDFLKKNITKEKKIEDILPYILGISLLLVSAIGKTSQLYAKEVRPSFNIKKLEEVSTKLKKISSNGDIVFTDDWDVFPAYFLFNSKNYYIVGLDPTFMNEYDSSLYNIYSTISSGETNKNLERIRDIFNAKWVLVKKDHSKFKNNLISKPDLFQNIFDNQDFSLFKVIANNEKNLYKLNKR